MITSAFAEYADRAWPYRYHATVHVDEIHGGVPNDPKVAEGWLRKIFVAGDDVIRQLVTEAMVERGWSPDEEGSLEKAIAEVISKSSVNGFKQDRDGNLYIEGRQIKAALKEAVSVCVASGKLTGRGWGATNKGALGFAAEHVFVPDRSVYLGVSRAEFEHDKANGHERCGIDQRFVHGFKFSAIRYEEYVRDVDIEFTVKADHQFTEEQWAMIWLTGEQQGLGAARSQGFGAYTVTRWEQLA